MLTLFDLTVPVFLRGFDIIEGYIDTAEAFASGRGLQPSALIEARLAPDMLTFAGQIQRASDNAKNGIARLAGTSAPGMADDELTFDELRDRIERTRSYLRSVRSEVLSEAEQKTIELQFRSVSGQMPGRQYVVEILVPNFFFHVATAHGILRSRGVELGKRDYLGSI